MVAPAAFPLSFFPSATFSFPTADLVTSLGAPRGATSVRCPVLSECVA